MDLPPRQSPAATLPILIALAMTLLPVAGAGDERSRERDWGRVAVGQTDGRWEATLQNSELSMRYGRVVENNGTKDRIVDLSILIDGRPRLIGSGIDTRHSNGRQEFFLLTDARVVEDGAARKTVQLVFGHGARRQNVSIYPRSRVFTIEYLTLQPSRHSCDLRLVGDTFYAHGAEEWQALRGWPMRYPKINDKETTGDDAYYRRVWGPPGPLACNGRLIVGRFERASGFGFGSVVRFDDLDWFKFTRSHGLERMMRAAPYTVHHFVVSGGAEEIAAVGRQIAEGRIP